MCVLCCVLGHVTKGRRKNGVATDTTRKLCALHMHLYNVHSHAYDMTFCTCTCVHACTVYIPVGECVGWGRGGSG